MKFQFRLKNGETHEFTLPDAAEIHRAIMWVPKSSDDKKKEAPNFIIIPDDVEKVEVFDETEQACAARALIGGRLSGKSRRTRRHQAASDGKQSLQSREIAE